MNAPRPSAPDTPRDRRRGSALVIVVLLLAALSVLLGSLMSGVHASLARRHSAWRDQLTRAIAEAGIQRAAAQLAENTAYAGEKEVPLGDGFFSVQVSQDGRANAFRVVCTAELRDGERTLRRSVAAARVTIENHDIVAIDPADPGVGGDTAS